MTAHIARFVLLTVVVAVYVAAVVAWPVAAAVVTAAGLGLTWYVLIVWVITA